MGLIEIGAKSKVLEQVGNVMNDGLVDRPGKPGISSYSYPWLDYSEDIIDGEHVAFGQNVTSS